jgi:hypothetical protein
MTGDNAGRGAVPGAGEDGVTLVSSALDYVEEGFALLPLVGKEPHDQLIRKTHGRTRGSIKRLAETGADEEQIRFWFTEPNVNIGIFCGEPSGGLVVLDVDDCAFPPPAMTLTLTPTVKTGRDDPRRGYHLYYRSDEPVPYRAFEWGEVRGWTGADKTPIQVVAPPSVHPDSGRRYAWQLPLNEVPIADFESVDLGVALATANSSNAPTPAAPDLRTTRAVLLRPSTTTESGEEWWHGYARDADVAKASALVLGTTTPPGQPFHCVLHDERNASASLVRAVKTGEWLYHDFHAGRHQSPEWLTLPQVLALKAGRSLPLSASEHATWALILYVEAGVLAPVQVPAQPLPTDVDPVSRLVYDRVIFLLACRWNYDHGDPVPLERRFVAAIANLDEWVARRAIDDLHQRGHIYVADRAGRTRLWLPAGISPPPRARQAHGRPTNSNFLGPGR